MREPLNENYSWGVPDPANLGTSAMRWTCGFCGHAAASSAAYYPKWQGTNNAGHAGTISIRICGNCQRPTFFEQNRPNSPPPRLGEDVEHLPADVQALYDEARGATSAGAFTSAVLAARKLLMHVAVEQGADEGARFIEYVEYLVNNHFVPQGSQGWVDYIRTRGNEANHEILIMTEQDARAIITLTTQLLRNVYELPASIPAAPNPVDTE